MLVIFEGLDKSGKSTMAKMLLRQYNGLTIRKTYDERLYPIDYSQASMYDWQAILDRVILPNNDKLFVADRSFLTQTAYQVCLGTGVHTITDEQMDMFNAYCEVVKDMPHLIVYCRSARYEFDSMVTNMNVKMKLDQVYMTLLENSGMNTLVLNMDNDSFVDLNNKIVDRLQQAYKGR